MMTELVNYLAQVTPAALHPSNFASEKLYSLAVLFAWCDALTSVGAAFMSKMIPLRRIAVLNNIFGWTSGLLTGSISTLVKHSINFPLNISRWRQMRQLIDKVKISGNSDLNVDWLKPFMQTRKLKAGELLFSLGDDADEVFILTSGEIKLLERNITIAPGTLFGEMALFTESGKRTATAVCETDVTLSLISYEGFEQLYFQNPEFGLYLVRLLVQRFHHNLVETEKVLHARERELLDELRHVRNELVSLQVVE